MTYRVKKNLSHSKVCFCKFYKLNLGINGGNII